LLVGRVSKRMKQNRTIWTKAGGPPPTVPGAPQPPSASPFSAPPQMHSMYGAYDNAKQWARSQPLLGNMTTFQAAQALALELVAMHGPDELQEPNHLPAQT